jgi:hypothetical protein
MVSHDHAEAVRIISSPPRGCQLAHADVAALPLPSRTEGYERFKKVWRHGVTRRDAV